MQTPLGGLKRQPLSKRTLFFLSLFLQPSGLRVLQFFFLHDYSLYTKINTMVLTTIKHYNYTAEYLMRCVAS